MKKFELEQHRHGHSSIVLGGLINIDPSAISCWRRGLKKIQPEQFKKLLELGYDEQALINPSKEVPDDK